jgi:hypothetical protein
MPDGPHGRFSSGRRCRISRISSIHEPGRGSSSRFCKAATLACPASARPGARRYRWTVGCALRPGTARVRSDAFATAVVVTGQHPVLQQVVPRRQQYPFGKSGCSGIGGQQTGKPTEQQPAWPASFTSGRQQLGPSAGQHVPKGSCEFGAQQTRWSLQNPPKEQQRSVFAMQAPWAAPWSLQQFLVQHCFPLVQPDPGFLHAAAASCRPRRPSAVHNAPLASTLSARRREVGSTAPVRILVIPSKRPPSTRHASAAI